MSASDERAGATGGYRDLNKNGRLDPYEDPSRPVEERVADLLSQMTLEEKAGLLFHPFVSMNPDGTLLEGTSAFGPFSTTEMVESRLINHFAVLGFAAARPAAEWQNRLQALAEGTRLGIPVTLASDYLHGFASNPPGSVRGGQLSRWPEQIGLAATGDPALVAEFADIARREYLALGVRVTLQPMADLATEPRWARVSGTFGEDADLAATLVAAYIRGFQGEELGPASVACMTKHFPGGGPAQDGEDPHFPYGKQQVYPGDHFTYHLRPFEAALAAGTAQIMPSYGVPVGLGFEEVGCGFNRDIITTLLRGRYGFDGVVCTDFNLLTDKVLRGRPLAAVAWGVEHLSVAERALRVLEAGCDQFGGEACPEVIVELVRSGRLPEARVDVSVRRLLREKFRLGLFDNPFVDVEAAEQVVGCREFREAGEAAQRRSIVLLKNGAVGGVPVLPLRGRPRIYVENIDPGVARDYGEVVHDVDDAELAILRLRAPYEPRDTLALESFYHAGDLRFGAEELTRILGIARRVPTIVDIYLERPAVLPEIATGCAALVANFGASDGAVLDVLFGRHAPEARLPFEMPSSIEAVWRQFPDVPYDSADPLFRFGHGLTYSQVSG